MRPRIGVVSIVFSLSVAGGRGARRFDGGRLRRDRDRLGHARYLHARRQPDRFTDGDQHVFLDQRREARQLERDRIASRWELQRDETAVTIGDERAREVGVDVADFDIDAGQHGAAGIDHDPFDHRCRDLRLRPGG